MSSDRQRFLRVFLGTMVGFAIGVYAAQSAASCRDSRPAAETVAVVAPIGVLYTYNGNGPFQVAEVTAWSQGSIVVRTTDGGEVATTNGTVVLYAPAK